MTPRPPSAETQALYVYAFVDPLRCDTAPLHGSEPAARLQRLGAIGALVAEVAVTTFRGSEAERNLADPAWLLPRVRHHEAVVERAMQSSPVFPVPFATLYSSAAPLAAFMKRHEATIASFLGRVAGQLEWTLRVTAELDDLYALDRMAEALFPEWSSDAPGLRYLRLRREQAALRRAAVAEAARLASGIVGRLGTLATAMRPLAGAGAGGAPSGAAYALLVEARQGAAFGQRFRDLADAQEEGRFHINLSGPWPPYSFRPALDDPDRPEGP